MSKLKMIRNREEDLGHEFDLRGLGEDPILREADPIAVLSISGDDAELTHMTNLIRDYGMGVNIIKGEKEIHVHSGPSLKGGHKVQTVELYGLSLFLIHKMRPTDDVTMSLWIANRLRFHLEKSDASRFDLSQGELSKEIHWDGFLTLAQPVTLFLNQAGFDISRSQDRLTMDRPTALAHLQRELAKQTIHGLVEERKAN